MATIVEMIEQANALYAAAFEGVELGTLSDDELIAVLGAVERHGRPVDSSRVASATEVAKRSNRFLGRDSLAWKRGCRTGQDLITQVTLVSGHEANRRVRLGEATTVRRSVGAMLPPLYPAVAAGVHSGALGVDTAEVIVAALRQIASRVAPDDLLTAERAMVASALGETTEETFGLAGEGLTHSADLIRGQAEVWKARLDPDGVAPNEENAKARSVFGFGHLRNGLYPLRGGVTPELRGVMNGIFDTHLSAHTARPAAFPSMEEQSAEQAAIDAGEVIIGAELTFDNRSGAEKRADILRMVLEQAARAVDTPSMGGAAPVVSVHVNAVDLLDGHGVGWIDGVEAPISMRAVRQMICNGGSRKIVFGQDGEVLYLGEKERFFTAKQRQAMAARDGGCVIPGCPIAAVWCEAHHVISWQQHGKTDITNGVMICWVHHASIETSGWEIRMINGKPQVKAPRWIDPSRTWRSAAAHRASSGTARSPSRN